MMMIGGSGLLINRLNVQKKLVKLDLVKYNEQLISKQIFTNTVKIFQKDETTSIKALCTFHTIAERLTPGASEVEKRDIYFTTNTEQFFELNYQQTTQKWAQQLAVDIDEWVENGSGFAITNIVSAHCTFVTYKDDFGGSGADIPDKFYKCGRLIRVINTPVGSQECFKLCLSIIRNGATEIPKQTTALRKLSGIIVDYNDLAVDQELDDCIKTYDEPFVLSNIPKIAKELATDFNVFRLHRKPTNNNNYTYSLTTIYAGRPTTDNQANILYYNNHFCKIHNLKSLLCAVTGRREKRNRRLCATCLMYIDSRYFKMEEHYKTCKLSAGTVTKFPKEGDTYKFKQHCLMVDNPYYIVADFEASNATDFKPITTLNSHAQKVHRINSYCMYLYIQPQLDSFPYDDFQETQATSVSDFMCCRL